MTAGYTCAYCGSEIPEYAWWATKGFCDLDCVDNYDFVEKLRKAMTEPLDYT